MHDEVVAKRSTLRGSRASLEGESDAWGTWRLGEELRPFMGDEEEDASDFTHVGWHAFQAGHVVAKLTKVFSFHFFTCPGCPD